MLDCLCKGCYHDPASASPDTCGEALLADIIERRGDPSLLTETTKLAGIFRVYPLAKIYPYGATSVPSGVHVTMWDYLSGVHPDLTGCYEANVSVFADNPNGRAAAVVTVFNALLPSMGLRYVDPKNLRNLVSDDPDIDYGYGRGAAVTWRRGTWGRGDADIHAANQPAAAATRTVIMMMFALGCVKRPDLSVELFSRLIGDAYITKVTPVEKVANVRSSDTPDQNKICKACFADRKASIFGRAMLTMRDMAKEDVKRSSPDLLSDDKRWPGCCKCGLSVLRFRVKSADASDTEPPTTIETCPYYMVWAWKKGCTGSDAFWIIS